MQNAEACAKLDAQAPAHHNSSKFPSASSGRAVDNYRTYKARGGSASWLTGGLHKQAGVYNNARQRQYQQGPKPRPSCAGVCFTCPVACAMLGAQDGLS